MEQLADRFVMDRINFSRRFKQATQLSPADYIQRIKVEAAKRQFESTGKQINEVVYGVGYGGIKVFRNTFKKISGMTPADYWNNFYKSGTFILPGPKWLISPREPAGTQLP